MISSSVNNGESNTIVEGITEQPFQDPDSDFVIPNQRNLSGSQSRSRASSRSPSIIPRRRPRSR